LGVIQKGVRLSGVEALSDKKPSTPLRMTMISGSIKIFYSNLYFFA